MHETDFHFVPYDLYAMVTCFDDPNIFGTATRNWGGMVEKSMSGNILTLLNGTKHSILMVFCLCLLAECQAH